MALVLPKEIGFDQQLPSLPADTTAREIVLQPSNGSSSYGASSLIEFTLPQRQFLEPGSMYLRFKMVVSQSSTADTAAGIRGVPGYTVFQKLEEYAGSQQISNQNEYGLIMNDLCNLTMSQSDKYGLQYALGLSYINRASTGTNDSTSGQSSADHYSLGAVTSAAPATLYLAVPLQCAINNCEKLYPLEFSPQYMLRLTTDSISNIIYATTIANWSYTLSNVELVYNQIEFSNDVLGMVAQMGGPDGKFFVKSQSWANSSVSYAAGSGSRELTYSHRYSSIKSVFAHFATSSASALNGKFDSVDPATTGGTFQFTIDSKPYPERELSTTLNKGAILMELRRAMGGITNKLNSMSINTTEFSYVDGNTTTLAEPAKFIVGTNCERLPSQSLLTGTSSNNANLTLRFNGTNTNTITAYLYVNYDLLFEVDVNMKNVVARY